MVQRCLQRLERGRSTAQEAPTAREGVERPLRATARGHSSSDCARGCHVMDEPVLAAERHRQRDAVRARVPQDRDEGEVPPGTDVDGLVDVVLADMSARAREGATRAQLDAVIDRGRASWPTSP